MAMFVVICSHSTSALTLSTIEIVTAVVQLCWNCFTYDLNVEKIGIVIYKLKMESFKLSY